MKFSLADCFSKNLKFTWKSLNHDSKVFWASWSVVRFFNKSTTFGISLCVASTIGVHRSTVQAHRTSKKSSLNSLKSPCGNKDTLVIWKLESIWRNLALYKSFLSSRLRVVNWPKSKTGSLSNFSGNVAISSAKTDWSKRRDSRRNFWSWRSWKMLDGLGRETLDLRIGDCPYIFLGGG